MKVAWWLGVYEGSMVAGCISRHHGGWVCMRVAWWLGVYQGILVAR